MRAPGGPPPSAVEVIMREFRCLCGAGPGDRCLTWTTRVPVSNAHADRYRQAVAAGRLPIREEAS